MILQFRVEDPTLRIQSVQFGDPLAAGSERLKDRVPDIKGQPYSRFAIEVFENEQVRRCMPRRAISARRLDLHNPIWRAMPIIPEDQIQI